MKISNFLRLSHVPRWVVIDRFKEQSVADHAFRVACFSLVLIDWLEQKGVKGINKGLALELAITHDVYEAKSGDIPTTFKAIVKERAGLSMYRCLFPEVPNTEKYEGSIVKLADLMEAISWIERYGVNPKFAKQYIAPLLNEQLAILKERTITEKQVNLTHYLSTKVRELIAEAATHD